MRVSAAEFNEDVCCETMVTITNLKNLYSKNKVLRNAFNSMWVICKSCVFVFRLLNWNWKI